MLNNYFNLYKKVYNETIKYMKYTKNKTIIAVYEYTKTQNLSIHKKLNIFLLL